MITQDKLKEILHYDPCTGLFVWIKQISSHAIPGTLAGSSKHRSGYQQISVLGKIYLSHRLAFLYMDGLFPNKCVDHIDGSKSNNRFDNLRLATKSQNQQNRRRREISNKSGFLGVTKTGSTWRATIRYDGSNRHLGSFATPEEAHVAYVTAKRINHEFCTI